jgi:polysaccharide export outer membrane protein
MGSREAKRYLQSRVGIGRRLVLGLLVLCVGAPIACKAPPPLPPEPSVGAREPYVIGVTDTLMITVWKNVELGGQVVVRSDGKISVPLLDDVQAEGLTPEELKEVITEALSEYVTNPDVTVIVTGMNSNTVSIMGGVGRTGELPLQKQTRVLQAIARSGGFSTWAKKDRVRILRPTPQGLIEYRFDYGAYLAGKAPGTNLVLRPGDTIVVPD